MLNIITTINLPLMTPNTSSVNLHSVSESIKRFLPNSQAVALAIILFASYILIYSLSNILMPVFASIVFAYLLEGLVGKAEKRGLPRLPAVYLVFSAFMTCLGFLLFYLMPLVSQQAIELIQHIPDILNRAQIGILRLPEMYPKLVSENKVQQIMFAVQKELLSYGQSVLSLSAASVVGLVSALVYLFLVPMMVFFFLKDKATLISWFLQFMPKDRNLSVRVWKEVDIQLGNYVRGKLDSVVCQFYHFYNHGS